MRIKKLDELNIGLSIEFVWKTFLEFEAPDYSEEGINTFLKSINDNEFLEMLDFYGAFERGLFLGMIATRNYGSHISLFFVKKEFQGKGVGKKLFKTILNKTDAKAITVNSSPYAVPIYKKLGFSETNHEQIENGMRFTPMIYKKQ